MLPRPSSPTGDPAAEDRLARDLIRGEPDEAAADTLGSWVAARTEFFDREVLAALAAHVGQVVIVGAGYDGRALRFRTPGVRFFEIDHPLTQRDKRQRLEAVGARTDDVAFGAADLMVDDIDEVLGAVGHVASQPTLFLCEGLLRYLSEGAIRSLLLRLAPRAAPSSVLSVSIATRDPGDESVEARAHREARETRLAAAGEPVLTVPPRAVALEWLARAGWAVAKDAVEDSGSGRLLVRATR
jgi:methyltransferase (TIGR00027 family)